VPELFRGPEGRRKTAGDERFLRWERRQTLRVQFALRIPSPRFDVMHRAPESSRRPLTAAPVCNTNIAAKLHVQEHAEAPNPHIHTPLSVFRAIRETKRG